MRIGLFAALLAFAGAEPAKVKRFDVPTTSIPRVTTSVPPVARPKKTPVTAPPAPIPPASSSDATEAKVTGFKRRPSLESGMRYSSSDWLVNFISTPTSFILRRISGHVLANIAITLLVIHFYPKFPGLSIPMVGHTLLGSSLGLLLSYRTNSAYARFWEARGYWTKTKSTCRNLATNILAHTSPHSPMASKHFLELLAVYPLTLMHLCLGGAARLSDQVQAHIPVTQDPDQYYDQPSLPGMLMCLELHKAIHHAASESRSSNADLVEAMHLTEVSHMIDSLLDNLSSCEKILRTPVPWTYSRHTSRFLTLWMATLPFALVGTLSPGLTLAVVVAASYCMLGIEEIGHLIEQPFLGDPVSSMDQIFGMLDDDGKASALIQRGRKTQPYDIGIPVCSLAMQIRNEVEQIVNGIQTNEEIAKKSDVPKRKFL